MPLTGNPKVRGIIVDVLNRGNGCLGAIKLLMVGAVCLKMIIFAKNIRVVVYP